MVDKHIRAVRKEELLTKHGGYFDEEDAERVVSWLVAAEDRRPVVLVGSGFTLNAIDQRTGNAPSEADAPLWQGVASRLAGDLGVDAGRYDAPFMAEMYEHAFGTAKLVDMLRATVADEHLGPGEAHKALANYDAAAIVTMNCLDTVLDRACGDRFRTIVEDTDLSSADSRPEILYLHGHRGSPASWVMTRSQYEDWPKRTPVMLTRARQLLAQHPWLVVGYSLSDLDFHSITRLVSAEMKGCRPLSLVLARNPPTAPERMHWRGLGYEIVHPVLDDERTMGSFLAWALENLGTTYIATEAATQRHVQRGPTPAERLERFRATALPVVDVEKAFRSWQESVRSLLDNEQRETSAEYARRVVRFHEEQRRPLAAEFVPQRVVRPAEPDVPRLVEPLEDISKLEPGTDPKEHRELWELHLLWEDAPLRDHVTMHFKWALLRGLFDGSPSPLPLPAITLRLARCAGWKIEQVQPLVDAALETARRYDDTRAEHLITVEATRSGCTVVPAAVSPLPAHGETAKSALQATLNGEFELAAEQYLRAVKQAKQAGRLFEAWTYAEGHRSALKRRRDDLWFTGSVDERVRLDALVGVANAEVALLESEPSVDHWLTTTRNQREDVRKDLLQEHRRREQSLQTGNRTMRFSDSHHQAWRRFRDISFIFGDPARQRWCFEPLEPVDIRSVGEVLIYSENPKSWISSRCRDRHGSLDERKRWAATLVSTFFDRSGSAADTKTALVRRLECLPLLSQVLRADDGPIAFECLQYCASRIGAGKVTTAFGARVVDYWKAFSCVVRSTRVSPGEALSEMRKLTQTLGYSGIITSQALEGLPWRRWQIRDGVLADEFVKLLTVSIASGWPDEQMDNAHNMRFISSPMFTLIEMMESGIASEIIKKHLAPWTAYLDRVRSMSPTSGTLRQVRRSGFLLETELVARSLVSHQPVSEVFNKWFPDDAGTRDGTTDRDEVWTVLAELLENEELPRDLDERVQDELNCLLSPERLRVWQRNPHIAHAAKRFASAALSDDPQCDRLENFLLQLYESSPEDLDLLADVMHRDYWSEDGWRRVSGVVIAACGGGKRGSGAEVLGDPEAAMTQAQLGVLALCANMGDVGLRVHAPVLWSAMMAVALSSATESRSLVANHAAFAVVQHAGEVESAEEANLFASTIDRMANDPRPVVRFPLASVALRLSQGAKHQLVQEAAYRALDSLRSDDNGTVSVILDAATRTSSEPTDSVAAGNGSNA